MKKKIIFCLLPLLSLVGCGTSLVPPSSQRLTQVKVTNYPDKLTYFAGDYFDPTGMIVTATYSDGHSAAVTNYTYAPTSALTVDDNTVTVRYSESGMTKADRFNISVIGVTPGEQVFENIPSALDFTVGDEYTFRPYMKNGYYTKNNFCFSEMGNEDLYDITSDGKAVFYTAGQQNLFIFSDDNYNKTYDAGEVCQLSIVTIHESLKNVSTTGIYSSNLNIQAFPGSTYDLEAHVLPNNATNKRLCYVSSNPEVTTVYSDGTLHNDEEGDSVITIYNDINNNNTLDEGEISRDIYITVKKPETQRTITLGKASTTISVGQRENISITLSPYVAGAYYGFAPDDNSICKAGTKDYVSSVIGVSPGKTTVEVRYDGAFAYLEVNVTENVDYTGVRASKVVICDQDIVLNKNDQFTLKTNIVPKTSVDTVSYTSNNESVATVNNGVVTAISSGTALITATTSNGKTDTTVVTVKSNETDSTSYYDGYYDGLTWTDSQDLVNKLHTLINTDFTALTYTSNWETNSYADEYIDNTDNVNLLYSFDTLGKSEHGTASSKWQREHCFAATLLTGVGTGGATTAAGRGTDFHNLYAALGSGNSSRSNKNFGYADSNEASYQDKSAYKYDRYNFEPDNKDKGKVARAVFYMSVMYNTDAKMKVSETWTLSESTTASISRKTKTMTYQLNVHPVGILENVVNFDRLSIGEFIENKTEFTQRMNKIYGDKLKAIGTTYQEGSDEFKRDAYSLYVSDYSSNCIGNLSTLLKWNTFAPDAQETQHCEQVYSHVHVDNNVGKKQGNRNPFVDYPELVNYIYGSLKDVPGNITQLTPSVK